MMIINDYSFILNVLKSFILNQIKYWAIIRNF